jgi:hypothetical protein
MFSSFFVLLQLLPRENAPFAIMALFFPVAFGFQNTARLELGDDGVSISWLGRFERFIPYAEVSAVSKECRWLHPNHRVVVACRGNATVDIPVWSSGAADEIEVALRDAVEAARCPRPKPAEAPPVLELTALERGDRSAEEWVVHLRRVGDGATPRSAAPPREVLWTIAQHPDAPTHARIAAAVALSGASASEGDRLRIAELTNELAESLTRDATDLAIVDEATLANALHALTNPKERSDR